MSSNPTSAIDPNVDPEGEQHEGKSPTYEDIAKIREMFLRTVEVPQEKRKPQILLCPVGIVGSGKTTVMKPLCTRLGLIRISLNKIRMLLKAGGFNYTQTLSIAHGVVGQFLQDGYSIGLDVDCVGSMKQFIDEQEKTFHVNVVWIHINPPEAFILKKFHRLGYGMLFNNEKEAVANYERRKPLHAKLDMPFAYVLDPSQGDLEQQLEYAAQTIEQMK
jgi:hypothetical protein